MNKIYSFLMALSFIFFAGQANACIKLDSYSVTNIETTEEGCKYTIDLTMCLTGNNAGSNQIVAVEIEDEFGNKLGSSVVPVKVACDLQKTIVINDACEGGIININLIGLRKQGNFCNVGNLEPIELPIGLPVELISFDGRAVGSDVELNWATASEENNDFFAVERSKDGRTFEQIGTIGGKGTTSIQQQYTYKDEQPAEGLNYYRLTQVDFDGTATHSKAVAVEMTSNKPAVQINPTYARDNVRVRLDKEQNQNTQIAVFDLSGAQVWQGVLGAGQKETNIDVSALMPGSYFLRMGNDEDQVVERFIKVNE